MDKIRMDSHKLIFHPERVGQWKKGELIYPIEIEMGISGACNHRCIFCAVDYMEYTPNFLDDKVVMKNLEILSRKKVKSIIYSGEGEPLLNKKAGDIFNRTKSYGIDAALSTNGVLLQRDLSEYCLKALSWIRFSIAGASDKTYEEVHQAPKGDFQKVLANLEDAVSVKKRQSLTTTLGVQFLLLPDNKDEVFLLAKILKEIGLDYLTVKPFSQHPQSKVKRNIDYQDSVVLAEELKSYESETFKIYLRQNSMKNLSGQKHYDRCYGLDFMTHIDAKGNVFPCVAFVGREEFCYGNLYLDDFDVIWESKRTKAIKQHFSGCFVQQNCRKACRLDQINKYLHELANPNAHVNFI